MPKLSKDTASETIAVEGIEVNLGNPDRCQFPRWAYVAQNPRAAGVAFPR